MVKEKRKWTGIVARDFKDNSLGETFGDNLVGRKLIVNLMNIADNPKKQNVNLVFKIIEVKENKAVADLIGYRVLASYIKRAMRSGVDKVEASFSVACKDGKLKIKPYILTRDKVQKGALSGIRKKSEEFLSKEFKDKAFKEIMMLIINSQVQIGLRKVLNKIYPITLCEFRIVEKV